MNPISPLTMEDSPNPDVYGRHLSDASDGSGVAMLGRDEIGQDPTHELGGIPMSELETTSRDSALARPSDPESGARNAMGGPASGQSCDDGLEPLFEMSGGSGRRSRARNVPTTEDPASTDPRTGVGTTPDGGQTVAAPGTSTAGVGTTPDDGQTVAPPGASTAQTYVQVAPAPFVPGPTSGTVTGPFLAPVPIIVTSPAQPGKTKRLGTALRTSTRSLRQWIREELPEIYKAHAITFWFGAGVIVILLVAITPPSVVLDPRRRPPPAVYSKSRVTATSFRNAKNETVRQVVWQDGSYNLVTAKKVGDQPNWTVTSISDSVTKGGHSISVLPGSALSCATPDFVDPAKPNSFWTDVYYITAAGKLSNVWTWNRPEKSAVYQHGALASYGEDVFTADFANPTSLVSYRDDCASPNCSGSTRVFFQAGNRKLWMASANTTSWATWFTIELSNPDAKPIGGSNTGVQLPPIGGAGVQTIRLGSPLAATRVAPANPVNGTACTDMRLFVDSSDMLQEYIYSASNRSWTKGPNEWYLEPGQPPPDVVATSYALGSGQPLNNMLTAIVFANGTIGQHHWPISNPEQVKSSTPDVKGATALAIADDRAYVVADGKIKEYRISWANPAQWTLLGDVPTTVGSS